MVPRLEKKCSSCLKALYKYIPSLLWLLRLLWVIFLATFELECLISEHDELLQYWTFWTKKLQRAWGTTTNSPTDPAQWIDETVLERYIYIYNVQMFKSLKIPDQNSMKAPISQSPQLRKIQGNKNALISLVCIFPTKLSVHWHLQSFHRKGLRKMRRCVQIRVRPNCCIVQRR